MQQFGLVRVGHSLFFTYGRCHFLRFLMGVAICSKYVSLRHFSMDGKAIQNAEKRIYCPMSTSLLKDAILIDIAHVKLDHSFICIYMCKLVYA